MKTSKPISTIAYQDTDYLIERLNELKKAKKIEYFMLIEHKAEGDDLKDHKHLFIRPAKLLQTEDLREALSQFDPKHPDKPIGCVSFRHSNEIDWTCYVMHDPVYLQAHSPNEPPKKFTYQPEEIISSDQNEFARIFHDVKYRELDPLNACKSAIMSGVRFCDLVASGRVPVGQIKAWKEMFYQVLESNDRDKRKAHDELNELIDELKVSNEAERVRESNPYVKEQKRNEYERYLRERVQYLEEELKRKEREQER